MSVISVSVGALWVGEHDFSIPLFIATLLAMVALHAATNLLNDYFDVKNGVDSPDVPTTRYRPHPLMNRDIGLNHVLVLALALYTVGIGLGIMLVALRGWPILAIGLVGAVVSAAYTAPPVVLKYRALGEIAVFLMWGPLAMLGAYYVQAQEFSLPLFFVSVPFGILVGLVLLANNIRDARYDALRGIRTIPVVFGDAAGRGVFVGLVAAAFAATLAMSLLGPLSPWSLIVLLSLPIAVTLCKMVFTQCPDDADARTAKLDTVFGLLLIVSLILQRFL